MLLSCNSKEKESKVEFVNINIYPSLGGLPSAIEIDLKHKTLVFNHLQQITTYNENCKKAYEKTEKDIDFVYVNLSNGDVSKIIELLDDDFWLSIEKINQKKDNNFPDIYDGIYFSFNIVKEKQSFSTHDLLILPETDETKIYNILQIINEHSNSEVNKEYIKHISSYLQ